MDSLTQIALGGVIAEAGFRDQLGRQAVVLGCVGGMLPDLDIVTGLLWRDPWVTLTVHRGITHSLLFVPLVSALLAWVFWRWWGRSSSYRSWYVLAFLVLFTHPLLDCCTSYGTQIFAPFSRVRVAWSCISIVDVFYTLPLFITLVVCPWIKKRRPGENTSWLGMAALLLTTAYLVYGAWNHAVALDRTLEDARTRELTILRAEVYPELASVWVWRTVVETPEGYLVGSTNTLLGKRVRSTFVAHDADPWIQRAMLLNKIRVFEWFTDGLMRKKVVRKPDGGGAVEFLDMRYGSPQQADSSLWGARVYVNQDGSLGRVERFYNRSFSFSGLVNRVITGLTTP